MGGDSTAIVDKQVREGIKLRTNCAKESMIESNNCTPDPSIAFEKNLSQIWERPGATRAKQLGHHQLFATQPKQRKVRA